MNCRTQILPPTRDALALAARLLKEGELVAFPTETVYGLGANALDSEAVLRIFAAKGRPADNPLIVHIAEKSQLDALCQVTEDARRLMDAYWPGPMTLLLPKKAAVPDVVTAGLPSPWPCCANANCPSLPPAPTYPPAPAPPPPRTYWRIWTAASP